jgi:hypothetical protein
MLNEITVKDKYPLPHIQDVFDQLGNSKVFSTLDLKAGYHQIPVAPEDIHKTAFRCHLGLFEFVRMPFGLTNGPGVFQRVMDQVLEGLIGVSVMVYLDDIVIFSENHSDHAVHIQQVLDRLRHYGLRLKATKCSFGLPEVKLLGFIINKHGIRSDPDKITAISQLADPTNVSEVRSFLGMAGYYRQCIQNFAEVARPLTRLTCKGVPFEFGPEQRTSFETLKTLLTSNQVMAHPDPSKPYLLFTDACNYAVGAILCQTDDNGVERVVQYVSHQLAGAQLRWATIEKEAYAVVYAIGKLRPYLYGAQFTVYTDHKPLSSLFTKEFNNTKIQRWGVLLAEYGAKIEYRRGKNNIRAHEVAVIDTDDWIDPDAYPDNVADQRLPIIYDGINLEAVRLAQAEEFPDQIRSSQEEDADYAMINGVLYSNKLPTRFDTEYPRLMLPRDFRSKVVTRAHKEVGHMALGKTLSRVREGYVWPGMRRSVKDVLAQCPLCITHQRQQENVPMGDMPLPASPMQVIGIDLIGPFPVSPTGNKYIMTIICHCSGWTEAYPIPDKSNQAVWDAFSNHFLPRHSAPEVLISDNGQEFCAHAFEDYLRQLGIDHRHSTPQHPKSNGKIERFHRIFKECLAKATNNRTTDWEMKMADVLWAHRNSVSSVSGFTPYYLLYGRRARIPLTRLLPAYSADVRFGNRLDNLNTALLQAKQATEESRVHNRQRLERRANAKDVQVGDTVIVFATDRVQLTSRWDPQYEVYRVLGTTCYLRHQTTGKQRRVHRERVRVVDPNLLWDDVRHRPTQQQQRRILAQRAVVNQRFQVAPQVLPTEQAVTKGRKRTASRAFIEPPPTLLKRNEPLRRGHKRTMSDTYLEPNKERKQVEPDNNLMDADYTELTPPLLTQYTADPVVNMGDESSPPDLGRPYRKRQYRTNLPTDEQIKRSRWEAIAAVQLFLSTK